MTIIRHRYSCMIGSDVYDVDAGTPWEAAVMAARQIGRRTARPADTIADGTAIDRAGMRAFITDQGEIIDVAPLLPADPGGGVNQLAVPEVSCHSRQEIEGGVIVRYLLRNPGDVGWRPVKLFRPDDASGATDVAPDQPERVIGADAAMEDAPS